MENIQPLGMSFSQIPNEILLEIFSFFEGNLLEKNRLVSSHWDSIIKNSEILWKDAYLKSFKLDPKIYNLNYKNGFIDQFNRLKRAEFEVIVKNGQKSSLFSVDSQNQKILKENLLPKGLEQLTCSPNGLFLVASNQNLETMIQILTLHPTRKENFGNPIIKIKNKFWAFYYYWSPDSNILTWMGNYQNTIGFCMLKLDDIILDHYNLNKNDIKNENILDYLESGNYIEISNITPILLGNPFYYSFNNSNKFCFHKSNKELGVFDCLKYEKLDIKLNQPFSIFCSPVYLNNGNIIVCTKNIKKDLYEVIMINQKGEELKIIKELKFDFTSPVITMLKSNDEKILAVSSASAYGVDLILIDLKTLESKKFDTIPVEDCFFLFGSYQNENILMIRTADNWECLGLNQSFKMGSEIKSLSEDFYSKLKYLIISNY